MYVCMYVYIWLMRMPNNCGIESTFSCETATSSMGPGLSGEIMRSRDGRLSRRIVMYVCMYVLC